MTRFLLDTHVLLWLLASPDQVSPSVRERLADPGSEVVVSAASTWEIAIKRALGRLDTPDDLETVIEQAGMTPLAITFEHTWEAGRLPPHHADPFDRMLVAQARTENLTLVSGDPFLRRYEVPIITP